MKGIIKGLGILAVLSVPAFGVGLELPNQAAVAEAIQFKVEKFTLANGLTVLIHEDHSTPAFTYQTWFRVGSKNEKPGLTGLAHFFEHMMFKGTEKYKGGVIDRMIQANGGYLNAWTSRDVTAYYFNLPSGKLKLAVDIEADRMRNLLFDPKEIQSEREVVKEERRFRYEDNIDGLIHEQVYRSVFKVHPYSWPVIGSMEDLNRATVADMMEFYRVHYSPNNAVIVIVGDVDAREARALIEKAYGPMEAQSVPPYEQVVEPEQRAERTVTLTKPVQNVTFSEVYPSVPEGHVDMYALDLLSSILGGGNTSRLYRRLVVKDQTVTSISVGSATLADAGVFEFDVAVKPGVNVDRVRRAIHSEVDRVRQEPVKEKELIMVKNDVMKSYVRRLRTNSGKAYALASGEIYFNNHMKMAEDLAKYLAVTHEDVQRVAMKYLAPERRSFVQVKPGKLN